MGNKFELGINNAFAIKKWVETDEWLDVIVNDIGLKNIQFSFDLLYPSLQDADYINICDEINHFTGQYDANISSTFTGLMAYCQNMLAHPNPALRKAALDYYHHAVKISSLIGARSTGGHLLSFSIKDYNDVARRKYLMESFFESMAYLSAIAKKHKLKSLVWEYMSSLYEPPHTVDECITYFEHINKYSHLPVKICFDLGHTTSFDIESDDKNRDVYYVLEKIIPYVNMIHLQQCDGIGDRYWPFTREYNEKGIIEPKKIYKIINRSADEKVDLYFEFFHGPEIGGQEIIEDYKVSAEYWLSFL